VNAAIHLQRDSRHKPHSNPNSQKLTTNRFVAKPPTQSAMQ
jgi:hypothetical protein